MLHHTVPTGTVVSVRFEAPTSAGPVLGVVQAVCLGDDQFLVQHLEGTGTGRRAAVPDDPSFPSYILDRQALQAELSALFAGEEG